LSWEEVRTYENDSLVDTCTYPQSLRIDFSNAQAIIISVTAFLDEKEQTVMGMMDNLIVDDNESRAGQLKMIV